MEAGNIGMLTPMPAVEFLFSSRRSSPGGLVWRKWAFLLEEMLKGCARRDRARFRSEGGTVQYRWGRGGPDRGDGIDLKVVRGPDRRAFHRGILLRYPSVCGYFVPLLPRASCFLLLASCLLPPVAQYTEPVHSWPVHPITSAGIVVSQPGKGCVSPSVSSVPGRPRRHGHGYA